MIKLSTRLSTILSEIEGESCADIGCDHGKLIIKALTENKIKKGFAIDISSQSLQKAANSSREEGVSSRLTLLCGDGANVLTQTVSNAVIAGMGANETVKILSQGNFAKKYVLSPHQDVHILRKYLFENNYVVDKDYYIFDKKFYPIIVAEKGETNYTQNEFYFGKNIPKTEEYNKFLELRYKKLSQIVEKLGNNCNPETMEEWRELQLCYNKK